MQWLQKALKDLEQSDGPLKVRQCVSNPINVLRVVDRIEGFRPKFHRDYDIQNQNAILPL